MRETTVCGSGKLRFKQVHADIVADEKPADRQGKTEQEDGAALRPVDAGDLKHVIATQRAGEQADGRTEQAEDDVQGMTEYIIKHGPDRVAGSAGGGRGLDAVDYLSLRWKEDAP